MKPTKKLQEYLKAKSELSKTTKLKLTRMEELTFQILNTLKDEDKQTVLSVLGGTVTLALEHFNVAPDEFTELLQELITARENANSREPPV